MVIESGDVALRSGRTYRQRKRDRSSVQGWGEVLSAATSPTATESRTITQKEQTLETVNLYQNYSSGGKLLSSSAEASVRMEKTESVEVSVRTEQTNLSWQEVTKPLTLRELLSFLILKRRQEFERFMENYRIGMQRRGSVQSKPVTVSFPGTEYQTVLQGTKRLNVSVTHRERSVSVSEEEQTQVQGTGHVKTADGREIGFDLELMMGRSFEQKRDSVSDDVSVRLTDPLVINFGYGCGAAELTDRTFRFDIDADGELDNIAILGQASGYLALDLNGDGVIGDGSELFGTKSGDGFADLRVYDADGNGWIDENDPVFDRLKIWSKDADGRDVLVGLGVRGIGAIFLGSTPSEFTLQDDAGKRETLGVVRSTGVFLREDGTAGTVQQLDLAKLGKTS